MFTCFHLMGMLLTGISALIAVVTITSIPQLHIEIQTENPLTGVTIMESALTFYTLSDGSSDVNTTVAVALPLGSVPARINALPSEWYTAASRRCLPRVQSVALNATVAALSFASSVLLFCTFFCHRRSPSYALVAIPRIQVAGILCSVSGTAMALASSSLQFVERSCVEAFLTSSFITDSIRTRMVYTATSTSTPAFLLLVAAAMLIIATLMYFHWMCFGQCGPEWGGENGKGPETQVVPIDTNALPIRRQNQEVSWPAPSRQADSRGPRTSRSHRGHSPPRSGARSKRSPERNKR